MDVIATIEQELGKFGDDYQQQFASAANEQDLRAAKATLLGKKGKLTELMKMMGKVPADSRKKIGERFNAIRKDVEQAFETRLQLLAEQLRQAELNATPFDLTLPGRTTTPRGHRHPLTQVEDDLVSIFQGLGFVLASSPEIDTEENNFTKLGFPPDHPATDMQDTFWVNVKGAPSDARTLLRTHTSSTQIREMSSRKPPMAVVSLGAVYRRDDDLTHSPMFHQMEGFLIDKHISFANLKGVLDAFAKRLYGEHIQTRFRPSYFPFVEPGAELDVSCVMCDGSGCRVCKNTGWVEILGCGMIHPVVFEHCGLDPEQYSGFAFGMGIERIAMTRYSLPSLKLLFENDPRFLSQFLNEIGLSDIHSPGWVFGTALAKGKASSASECDAYPTKCLT
jgi:phenylalanyl-tRNA synthetase alpha chain